MQITNITPTARKENDKIRIAAYCRVSTDSQDQIKRKCKKCNQKTKKCN